MPFVLGFGLLLLPLPSPRLRVLFKDSAEIQTTTTFVCVCSCTPPDSHIITPAMPSLGWTTIPAPPHHFSRVRNSSSAVCSMFHPSFSTFPLTPPITWPSQVSPTILDWSASLCTNGQACLVSWFTRANIFIVHWPFIQWFSALTAELWKHTRTWTQCQRCWLNWPGSGLGTAVLSKWFKLSPGLRTPVLLPLYFYLYVKRGWCLPI